jgi:hypothetical protein
MIKAHFTVHTGSNSKGLSKSALAIGSSSHGGPIILERKKYGSDPGQFHYDIITDAE